MIGHRVRPTRSERGRRIYFGLGRCPVEEVAGGDPETICQLHRRLAEGLTEELGGLEVEGLTARIRGVGGCQLVVQLSATAKA